MTPTSDEVKKVMVERIAQGAIKGVDLAVYIVGYYGGRAPEFEELVTAIQELLDAEEILEIEYRLPDSDKIKSIYFPAGTRFNEMRFPL